MLSNAAAYHNWYLSTRGAWIGATEAAMLAAALEPRPGETLLDVGSGTGFFTQALSTGGVDWSVGLDPNPPWVAFARARSSPREGYLVGQAPHLPFRDGAFDLAMSVTALCFVDDMRRGLAEMVRVARRRIAVGLLGRRSLLWCQKGRRGGSGGYRGARWDTCRDVRRLLRSLPVTAVRCRHAVFLPGGGRWARLLEARLPSWLPCGSFLLVVADVSAAPGGWHPA